MTGYYLEFYGTHLDSTETPSVPVYMDEIIPKIPEKNLLKGPMGIYKLEFYTSSFLCVPPISLIVQRIYNSTL